MMPQNNSKPRNKFSRRKQTHSSARGAPNKSTLHLRPSRIALCAMRIEVQAFEIAPYSLKGNRNPYHGPMARAPKSFL